MLRHSLLVIILALALIASFGAHDLVEHDHNEFIYGKGWSAALHGARSDTQSLPGAILIFSFELIFVLVGGLRFYKLRETLLRGREPRLQWLRTGLLNPKPY